MLFWGTTERPESGSAANRAAWLVGGVLQARQRTGGRGVTQHLEKGYQVSVLTNKAQCGGRLGSVWQVCQGTPRECTQRMLTKLWGPGHHAAARSAIPLAVCGGSAVAEVWARFGMKTPSLHPEPQTKTIKKINQVSCETQEGKSPI